LETDKSASFGRKVFWYYKNKLRQKKLFNKIERIRKEKKIEVFNGVFGGVVPLTFYMNENPRRAAVVFTDMDSWFTDVLTDTKKLWYRKYYSFNYALENADMVDFLSPYVLEGVKKRGVNVIENRASVTACSFADYTKCSAGGKSTFEIAFAARLEPDKNPMMYLEAANVIHAEFPDVKFHLLGEGTLVNEINGFLRANNLGDAVNFRFHNNPPEIFSETNVFVSLQSGTNYPSQSVLEAMACANAIVACNTGDTNLFINSSNGVLIDLNTENLIAALRELIQNTGRTKSLGAAGRNYVLKNHTLEKAAEYYTELYSKAYSKVFGGKN
jgi:glycosyltransferase involved in cell wall biosynthesis